MPGTNVSPLRKTYGSLSKLTVSHNDIHSRDTGVFLDCVQVFLNITVCPDQIVSRSKLFIHRGILTLRHVIQLCM